MEATNPHSLNRAPDAQTLVCVIENAVGFSDYDAAICSRWTSFSNDEHARSSRMTDLQMPSSLSQVPHASHPGAHGLPRSAGSTPAGMYTIGLSPSSSLLVSRLESRLLVAAVFESLFVTPLRVSSSAFGIWLLLPAAGSLPLLAAAAAGAESVPPAPRAHSLPLLAVASLLRLSRSNSEEPTACRCAGASSATLESFA